MHVYVFLIDSFLFLLIILWVWSVHRSGSYQVTSEGDSGNPLIDSFSPVSSPTKPQLNSDDTTTTTEELKDNYRLVLWVWLLLWVWFARE